MLTALEKLPADRFATAAEFGEALGGEHTGGSVQPTRVSRSVSRTAPRDRAAVLRWAWIPAALVGLASGLLLHRSAGAPEPALSASLLPPPGDCDFADIGTSNLIQLSPDGSSLAFVALCTGSRSLWIRNLADGTARAIAGTSNALYPFWAPDGQSMGFFAEGRLKRIDLASGTVRDLAPALNGRGGAWNQDGVILYAPDVFEPLYRIPAAGGTPERVTVLPRGADITQRLPYFLPDGHHFVFVEGKGQAWAGAVLVGDLKSPATTRLLEVPSNVAFSRGRLFYVRDGALFAQPFSPGKAAFTGSAVAVVPRLETWPFKYLGNFSVAGRLMSLSRAERPGTPDGLVRPGDSRGRSGGGSGAVQLRRMSRPTARTCCLPGPARKAPSPMPGPMRRPPGRGPVSRRTRTFPTAWRGRRTGPGSH